MKISITPSQLSSIRDLAEDTAAMMGGGDTESDKIWRRHIRNINKLLINNGYPKLLTPVLQKK